VPLIFRTERLLARDWTLDDVDAAYGIYRDPEVVRYLGSVPQPVTGVDAMRERVERWVDGNEALRGSGFGFWALCADDGTDDGTVVGATLLKPLPDADEVEVGWHLGTAYWGRGYATEGARGAVTYGFATVGLDVVYAVIVKENEASLAVARRLGMTYEGPTERYYGKELELFSLRP
jgi:[ribosomal protein S5]-alanine N-acetyltransferase